MSWLIKSILVLLYCYNNSFAQDDLDKFRIDQLNALQSMSDENNANSASVTLEIQSYLGEQSRLFETYKTEVENKWGAFKASSQSTLVVYDDDFNTRSTVDFDKGEVSIEVLVEDKSTNSARDKRRAGELGLEKALNKLLNQKAGDKQALLKDQILTRADIKVTSKNAGQFASNTIATETIKNLPTRAKDGVPRVKYVVKVQMVPNHIEVRAKRFKTDILKQSKRFDIDPAVAFAIMQTESYFNPMARSHVPAYGLMQLVPKSGARDAYQYVYKKDRLLKDTYLYNPANNIELGCAYLSKLRHVYFGDIKDDRAAYYCTISAYNTGPGNVARALSGTTKLGPATRVANEKSPDQVYRILMNKLPYDETKDYLTKVSSRIENYQAWTQ